MGFIDSRHETNRFGFVYMRGNERHFDCIMCIRLCVAHQRNYFVNKSFFRTFHFLFLVLFAPTFFVQVNTNPPVKSFHSLKGKRHRLQCI